DVFAPLLDRLVEELPALRQPAGPGLAVFGPVARRMLAAVMPHAATFITPMAAVAGAVADHVLAAMVAGRRLSRAYVNNGGDISLFLADGASFDVGMVSRPDACDRHGKITVTSAMMVRGVATSGWRGRSFSLGIADSVTVLARDAATADAAATMIGNAVTIDHPAIRRQPASQLAPDSDLGERLVTVDVGRLAGHDIAVALEAGLAKADLLRSRGLIEAACLMVQGEMRLCGQLKQKSLPLAGSLRLERTGT
ncbi:MAG TPA: UPF0280 family protein, partial [Telmatospirillum sp.]|nr:UPF0280 family protein [Telmatospirillum sp.]